MSNDILPTDTRHKSGQVTRMGKTYGCHCDLFDEQDPDGCVLDDGAYSDCTMAKNRDGTNRKTRWTCEYWRVVR